MKLMRYSGLDEAWRHARLGLLVSGDRVADVRAGYACYLMDHAGNPKAQQIADLYFPPYIVQFLHAGEAVWHALTEANAYLTDLAAKSPDATGLNDEELFVPLDQCRLYAPLRPSKIICVAGNYSGIDPLDERRVMPPRAFVKPLSAVVGPGRDIMKPAACEQLACESELAVVIGKRCKHVSAENAYDVVAGYTILTDITARDAGVHGGSHPFMGKAYDTFAPMGPWIVARESLPEAMNLRITTSVNGGERQQARTSDLLHDIPKLIEYFSQITLMPGDVISTGSPGGRVVEGSGTILHAGDVVESEIEGIGVLRNRVIDEPDTDSLNFSD